MTGSSITDTFVNVAGGQRVKSTVGTVTTIYIGGIYEYQAGATTHYYEGNALRRTGYAVDNGVTYLLQDHLKSSSSLINQNGTVNGDRNYFLPFGGKRGTTPFNGLTTKRFTGQYHEASLPGGEGLSYYVSRWYDAQLGRFLSADTIVPGPGNPQAFNRYSYVFNQSMRYTDPSGHCPWCFTAVIGAVIGGTVTGATYMLTTDYAQWNGGDIATVVGAGAIAGGLIGSGVGIAAGTAQMSAALATAASAAVASGTGAGVTAEVYMATNKIYGQQFDRSDFIVSTGTAAVEGAVNSMIPGSGLAAGTTRAAISAGFGSADYLARNHFNGEDGQSTVSGAVRAGAIWGAGSAAGDLLGGGFSSPDPSLLRNPITARDMTFTVWHNQLNSKLIREGISKEAKNALRPFARNFAGLLWITATDKEAQE